MSSFFFWLTLALFVFVCFFMILLILIQKGRGGGLASAFGGAGGNTAFGSKTGDVLTWTTSVVFGVFLVLAIVLNLLANHRQAQASNPQAGGPATALTEPPAAPVGPVRVDPTVPAPLPPPPAGSTGEPKG